MHSSTPTALPSASSKGPTTDPTVGDDTPVALEALTIADSAAPTTPAPRQRVSSTNAAAGGSHAALPTSSSAAAANVTSQPHPLLMHLDALSQTAPALVNTILSHVKPASRLRALRGAGRLLRRLVNRTVNTVYLKCPPTGPPGPGPAACAAAPVQLQLKSDLGATFPDAAELISASLESSSIQPDEFAAFLAHLLEACPILIGQLQSVELHVSTLHLHPLFLAPLAGFLSRCAPPSLGACYQCRALVSLSSLACSTT
jgi:hypothetical protein